MADLFCLMDTIEGAEGQQFPAVLLIITKAKHALKKHRIYHGTMFLHMQEPTVQAPVHHHNSSIYYAVLYGGLLVQQSQ